jgi:esterase/lipase
MLNAFEGEAHRPFHFEGINGGAVLLTHGFPGSPKEMRPVADIFHAMGWTTHGVLLPGFGPEIETIDQRTHNDWLHAVEGALKSLRRDHDTVILVGNSMGGALSIQAASRNEVDGLVLFAPFWKVDHFLWNALPVLKYVLPKFKPFRLFKPDFDDPEFQKGTRNFMPNADFDDPEFRQQTLNLEINTRIFDNIRIVGANAFEMAPGVDVPTLVIQGNGDDLVDASATQKLVGRIRGPVTYLEVDEAHNPLQPEKDYWPQVIASLQTFIPQFAQP